MRIAGEYSTSGQPVLNQIDLALWRLDALRRFLLKRVDDPDFRRELHRVDHAVRIAPERQRNLEHARPHAVHGLGNIGLAALGRDRQGGKTNRPDPIRKRLEFPERRFDP